MPTGGLRHRRVTQKGVAPEVRSRVVTKLVEAIDEAERLAKESGRRSKSGAGGISPKGALVLGDGISCSGSRWRSQELRLGDCEGEDGSDGDDIR